MGWQFWKTAGKIDNMPERLVNHLAWRYSIGKDTLGKLRYISKSGRFGVQKTTFMRVYDPALLNGDRAVKCYDDLDSHQKAVQFEGRWQSGRVDDLVDLRSRS